MAEVRPSCSLTSMCSSMLRLVQARRATARDYGNIICYLKILAFFIKKKKSKTDKGFASLENKNKVGFSLMLLDINITFNLNTYIATIGTYNIAHSNEMYL